MFTNVDNEIDKRLPATDRKPGCERVLRARGIFARRSLLCGWCVLLSFGVLSCGKLPTSRSSSDVSLGPAKFEGRSVLLSEVRNMKTLTPRFVFTNNNSNETTEVTVHRVSCGCLRVSLPEEEDRDVKAGDVFTVGPRQQKQVQLHLKPSTRPGMHSHSAEFFSTIKGGAKKHHSITAQLSVVEDITVSPPVINQSFPANSNEDAERTLHIDRTVRSNSASAEQPHFYGMPDRIELVNLVEHPPKQIDDELWTSSWDAMVLVKPGDDLQSSISERIGFLFGDDHDPPVHVPVTIVRKTGVEVLPRKLEFGVVRQGESASRKVLVRSVDHRPFEITRIIGDQEGVAGTPGSSDAGDRHWVEVTVELTQAGQYESQLAIFTTHPDVPRIIVDVHGVCR